MLLLNCVANSIFIHALICLVLECFNDPVLLCSYAGSSALLCLCSLMLLRDYAPVLLFSCCNVVVLQCNAAIPPSPPADNADAVYLCHEWLAIVLCCSFEPRSCGYFIWVHECALYCCMMSHNSFCSNETILNTASQLAHVDGTASSLRPVSALRDMDLLPSFSVHHITPTVLEMTYTDFI